MKKASLFSRNGAAVTMIGRRLLEYEVGSRIPRVEDFAAECGCGRGTAQNALKLLMDSRAVELESRGHLGTFMLAMDFTKLWDIAGLANLMGAMPLPYSSRIEGLAAGLFATFESNNVPFHLSYIRGASNRMQALLDRRCDFVIVSKKSALSGSYKQDTALLHSFGQKTYISSHVLLMNNPDLQAIQSGMRVGIDSSSTDQRNLTYQLCNGKNVEFVEMPYIQVLEQLIQGKIDAALWNRDEVEQRFNNHDAIYMVPLDLNDPDATEATMSVRKEDYHLLKNLLTNVDMDLVVAFQNDVINGKRIPRY